MTNLKKCSFTIIEVVFAIIIIGIVVTSFPMILSSTSNMQETNLRDKSFFNAYSLLTLIQTEEWDENNTVNNNYYKVLTAENGDSELKCKRKGVEEVNNSSGAICADVNKTTSHIGTDSGEDDVSKYDDIDDFDGYSTVVLDVNLSVKVRYMNDETDYSKKVIVFNENLDKVSDTNLKFVVLTVTDVKTKEVVSILKYISSNIGMVKIESRHE